MFLNKPIVPWMLFPKRKLIENYLSLLSPISKLNVAKIYISSIFSSSFSWVLQDAHARKRILYSKHLGLIFGFTY